MAGERGADGDLGRLQIAHFADHDHVRVLPQDVPQRRGEGVADFRMHLDLRDARHLVLHRVFHRDDLLHAVVHLLQSRRESGGFAGASGAGDQGDAVAGRQPTAKQLQVIRRHAKVGQRQVAAFLRQQAQHDGFAEGARHGGNADVHLLAGDALADAPVLRTPTFGDVETGDEFHPRGHRREAFDGLRQAAVEDAVHAHPHQKLLLGRLDVDVRGAQIHRLRQQVVHQRDDGRFLGEFAQALGVVAGEQRLHLAFLAHVFQQPVELVVGQQAEIDALARVKIVERLQQHAALDVARGAAQAAVGCFRALPRRACALALANAQSRRRPKHHLVVQQPVEFDGGLRHVLVHGLVVRQFAILAQIRHTEMFGKVPQQRVFGQRTHAHQQRAEIAAGVLLDLPGALQVRRMHRPMRQQPVGKSPIGQRYHGRAFYPLDTLPARCPSFAFRLTMYGMLPGHDSELPLSRDRALGPRPSSAAIRQLRAGCPTEARATGSCRHA